MSVFSDAVAIGKWVGRFLAVFEAFRAMWESVQRADEANLDAGVEQKAAALELMRVMKRTQAEEELS